MHALASLITQAQRLLPEAVAQAHDQELTWDEIGQLLVLTGSTAARRYRHTTTHPELTHAHHPDRFPDTNRRPGSRA